ncbi:hypothetical protein EPD60_08810 [Flaviaesturariibacter flavus]|uniref:Uncharacterized protein n=1 Tax=Flaviaesturariibacter flavus TaxID=2502780 RepID=A0A4R1BAU8_9BACT|nr:hypothetical protein [Flaviaesturariibacter flavus]TCJ14101.1 hypothetical protein EPD60_08810 [Flaviaesturariibacter flavus]
MAPPPLSARYETSSCLPAPPGDGYLRFTTTSGGHFDARYRISGQQLELRYACIEPCGDRFVKE